MVAVLLLSVPDHSLAESPERRTYMEALRAEMACRAGHACFASGTSREYMEQWERAIWGDVAPEGASAFNVGNRWSFTTAGATGSAGDPVTLTYSFVPDGGGNILHAQFDAAFGSRSAWQGLIQRTMNEWSAVAGVRFVLEPNDDGFDGPGQAGVRGDIRITCSPVDGPSGLLAFAFFPDFGDITFDAFEPWEDSTGDFIFLRNVLAHECGHALGIEHVRPENETKLMEAIYSNKFDGPQDDDIRACNFHYGDSREPNDARTAPSDVGTFSPNSVIDHMSLNNDEDWYLFRSSSVTSLSVRATPLGANYDLQDATGNTVLVDTRRIRALGVEVYSSGGQNPLRISTAALGQAASTVPVDINGDFLVRVLSASASSSVQRYRLTFQTTGGPARKLNVRTIGASDIQITASPADGLALTSVIAPGVLVYSNNQSVQLTAPATGAGLKLVGWVVDGISQTPGAASVTVVMTKDREAVALFADAPTVDAGADKLIVLNDSTSLTATATGGVPPYTYQWSPTDGLASPRAATTTAAPRVTTLYTCKVTDSTGAFGSDDVRVQVEPQLKAAAGKGVVGVAGNRFTLTGSATGGIPPYTFSWSPADRLLISNQATATGIFERTQTFTLTVSDAAGHTSKSNVTATVPAVVAVELGDKQIVRAGSSIELRAQVSGGFAPFTYIWDPSFIITAQNGATATVKPDATSTVRVFVSDSLGQQGSDEVTIEIASPLQVTATANPPAVGVGRPTTLSSSVSGGLPPYSFEWGPVVNVATPTSRETIATPIVTTTYGVNVRDSLGQTGAASVRVEVGTPSVSPDPNSQQDTPDDDGGASAGGCGGAPLAVVALGVIGMQPLRRRMMRH